MNKCQDILKVVRGNGFYLCLQVEARRTDGTAVEDFALQGDEVLKLLHNGTAETKPYETVGNNVFVSFDGDDDLGWYGLEMTGLFHDEPWRWCVPKVFQIVETNERANLPSWTFLADDTYIIGCGITLLSAVIHADWAETDTSAPSYIKNKPDLNEYALVTDLLATNQRVSTLENTAVKTVVQSFSELQKNTARNNISAASVAQVNAKQDTISDLSTIRSGAADGAVARGYLQDFSTRTHTPAEQVGQVLATVATQANGAQPRLTAGENITITEDNVISATGGVQSVVLDYQDEGVPMVVLNVDGDEKIIISGQQPSGPEYDVAPSWAGAEQTFEQLANKVTTVSAASTNSQYPTAKCLYDLVGDVATLLAAI